MHPYAPISRKYQNSSTFDDPAHFLAFLVVCEHQDRQRHFFCAHPFPKARACYKQYPLSVENKIKH